MCRDFTSDMITFSRRSDVMPGVSSKPGGALSIISCDRPSVMSTVLCCLAMHSCASPVGSYMLPITANTLLSSVSDVHAATAAAGCTGQIDL